MLQQRISALIDLQLLRFLIVGGANTLFGLSVIYLCKYLGGIGDVSANLIGYVCGVTVSFYTHRKFSFRHEGRAGPAILRYLLVILVAYQVNLFTVMSAIDLFGVNSYLAQALGIFPYTLITYLGGRLFAFRSAPA